MANETWNDAVADAIRNKGGQNVSLQEIYSEMRRNQIVTDSHLEPWKPGGQPKYECWIRRSLTNLERDGTIRRVGRALYSIR